MRRAPTCLTLAALCSLAYAGQARADTHDICVEVLESITAPVNEYNCWPAVKYKEVWGVSIPYPNPDCAILPNCCAPLLCKVSPDCLIASTAYEVIANPGSIHCFDDVTAEELFTRWVDKQIALGVDALTGGLVSDLYPLVNTSIDQLAASGRHLPPHIQDLLAAIIEPVYTSGLTGYTYDDISNIKVAYRTQNRLSKFWFNEGAITLGPVVILEDEDFGHLFHDQDHIDLYKLLTGQAPPEFTQALMVMIHELVHVNQFAELGREAFITNYLLKNSPFITDGYGHGPYEQEAYGFEPFIAEFHGGGLCDQASFDINRHIDKFLNRGHVVCRPVLDTDGDLRFDHMDNCPEMANPGQEDQNQDGLGDACDVAPWLVAVLSILQ